MGESRFGSPRCRRDGFRRRPDLPEGRFGNRAGYPEKGPGRRGLGHAGRRGEAAASSRSPWSGRARSRRRGERTCSARSRASTTIISIVPEGIQGQEGRSGLRARLGLAARPAHQPEDHHPGGRGVVPECQGGPGKRRDRPQGIRGRNLPAGEGHDPGRDQAGRIRRCRKPKPNWNGPADSVSD